MTTRVTRQQADHIVGRVSGVAEGDTRLQAAEKALATMKAAGMPRLAIRKAEKMVDQIRTHCGTPAGSTPPTGKSTRSWAAGRIAIHRSRGRVEQVATIKVVMPLKD